MVNKLDLKDRKILYELDLNSRQSFNDIAKKIGLSKNSVAYRVKNLQEVGIIKMFHTVIDTSKLGYIPFRLYLKLQDASPEKEQQIIDFLKEKEAVTWIVSTEGRYDIGALILVKTIKEMNSLWKELIEKYVNYLGDKHFSIMTKLRYFPRAYLLDLKQNKQEIISLTEPDEMKLDKTDIDILRLLAPNSRVQIVEIASKLNLTPKTIINRIKDLEKRKIIVGYKTLYDHKILGYQYFKIFFNIHNVTKEKMVHLKNYIKNHPNIIYDDEVLGGYDIEIEVQVKDIWELRKIINEMKSLFSEMIKDHEILEYYKEHKWLLLPVKL